MRWDGRKPDQLREVKLTPHVSEYAEGSCLVEFGKTKVLCTATFEGKAPPWLMGTQKGWVTAEYGMLPRATHQRVKRDKALNGGRTQEISRLLGRSLRAAVDLRALGEKQIMIDCDVLNADGGTRTASVTGGYVALALALQKLLQVHEIKQMPLQKYVAAISVGLQKESVLLDLNYEEDSQTDTDLNVVMTGDGGFVEIQGTAEKNSFHRKDLNLMLDTAEKGIRELFLKQAEIIGSFFPFQGK